MLVNADFTRSVIVAPAQYRWVASPQTGVDRVMLDRVGTEQARATSIVRYAPDSWFSRHQHPGGEEILVLSGTFSEGNEHYPAGWYPRNLPGSSHQPSSREGATLFVKLRQMSPGERHRVRIDTPAPSAWRREAGREVCLLFSDAAELISLQRLAAGASLFADAVASAELLVLAGDVMAHGESYGRGSWIRLPAGALPDVTTGVQGATFYLKTGHSPDMAAEA